MSFELLLIYLNAACVGTALAGIPLMHKARLLFNTEDMIQKEWAFRTDSYLTRILLTGFMTMVVQLLMAVTVLSLRIKGLGNTGLTILNYLGIGLSYTVLVKGFLGAMRVKKETATFVVDNSMEPPARHNMVSCVIIFSITAVVYAISIQRLINIIATAE